MAEQNTGCLHDYQILSQDAKLIADADVFIINGAGMETFLEDIYMSNENLKVIDSSEGVTLIENCDEHHENHNEETHHDHNHSVNSHIWMSPENAKLQVENIAESLVSFYPQYKSVIEENKNDYINRLTELSEELSGKAEALKNENIITFHESYDYLASEYGFNVVATVESHEGAEPSAKGLAELVEIIEKHNVNVLFTEPDYKGSSATILSNETGARILTLNPVIRGEVSLTAYEDIMRANLETILKAVK
jgi:zinc transport system substrate-binding protein